jgi:transcriptional regulator with XRE-family HTH domain
LIIYSNPHGLRFTAVWQDLDAKIGPLVRKWRKQRKLSQMELALRAGTSARHLSFVETGRAQPSRDMILRLADQLGIAAPERNALLLAAGYAPVYDSAATGAPPDPGAILRALTRLVDGREPYPTFVVDAGKNVRLTNRSTDLLLDGVAPELLGPKMNIVRLALHPGGMFARAANQEQWLTHLLRRLEREASFSGSEELAALYQEAKEYHPDRPDDVARLDSADHIMAPLRIHAFGAELGFLNVVTTFGTPVDIALTQFTIETFYPADAATAALLHERLRGVPDGPIRQPAEPAPAAPPTQAVPVTPLI